MGTTAQPLRYGLGEIPDSLKMGRKGTIVVRPAIAAGDADKFRTTSPCCEMGSLVSAAIFAGIGKLVTCRECGWKWDVWLSFSGKRLPLLDREARHPNIQCNEAEWVSKGYGTHRR